MHQRYCRKVECLDRCARAGAGRIKSTYFATRLLRHLAVSTTTGIYMRCTPRNPSLSSASRVEVSSRKSSTLWYALFTWFVHILRAQFHIMSPKLHPHRCIESHPHKRLSSRRRARYIYIYLYNDAIPSSAPRPKIFQKRPPNVRCDASTKCLNPLGWERLCCRCSFKVQLFFRFIIAMREHCCDYAVQYHMRLCAAELLTTHLNQLLWPIMNTRCLKTICHPCRVLRVTFIVRFNHLICIT